MRKSKKVLSVTMAAILTAVLFTSCGGGNTSSAGTANQSTAGSKMESDVLVIKYGTPEMANMSGGMNSQWITDQINERSGGRIKMEVYLNGTLGNDAETLAQVIDGTLPIGQCGIGAFGQYTSLLECVQLPFLITDTDLEQQAFATEEFKALTAQVESELGIKFLAFGENGMRHFATIDKPIETIDDLKGMKIRIAPSNMLQDAMNLLGTNPNPLAYSELYSALQNKVIDGEEINISSVASQKHYEVIHYFSEIGMYPFPCTYFMNAQFYNALSDEDKALIETVFAEGQERLFAELLPTAEKDFRQECIDNGVVFNTITDISAFEAAVAPVYDTYTKDDPKTAAFVEKVRQMK